MFFISKSSNTWLLFCCAAVVHWHSAGMIVGPVGAASDTGEQSKILMNSFAGETWSTLSDYPLTGPPGRVLTNALTTVSITARVKA